MCLSHFFQGFSRFVVFRFRSPVKGPTRNIPERVRDTIRTFPKKVGDSLVWKPLAYLLSMDITTSLSSEGAVIRCLYNLTLTQNSRTELFVKGFLLTFQEETRRDEGRLDLVCLSVAHQVTQKALISFRGSFFTYCWIFICLQLSFFA